jgi:hypothetical protein
MEAIDSNDEIMFASLMEEEADVATADDDENLIVLSFLLSDTCILHQYLHHIGLVLLFVSIIHCSCIFR